MHNNTSNSLKTDLYELTMAAGYFENNLKSPATFELYCHTMPERRSYLVTCGLEQVVHYILNLRFTKEDINFLKSLSSFRNVTDSFFKYLSRFRFSGNVWAMEEGQISFANEPMIQIEAPLIEAQILETYILSVMNIQTLVATKAARVVQAAQQDGVIRTVIDFGSRRAHGPQAGIFAARASYIAGCAGTSNIYAGREFGIPVFGTMAHSWVEAFRIEEEAFQKYYEIFPQNTILLIDTYNTLNAAKKVTRMNSQIKGVRLDSGNLQILSQKVRKILDQHKKSDIKIIASGNLNEYKISRLVTRKAPIDIYGVGTEMVVSRDDPALDLTYKLVQINHGKGLVHYTAKSSQGKHTVPGRKQVFRRYDSKGSMKSDLICLADEKRPKGTRPLLKQVIKNGKLLKPLPKATQIRKIAQKHHATLPSKLLKLKRGGSHPVTLSPTLKHCRAKVMSSTEKQKGTAAFL